MVTKLRTTRRAFEKTRSYNPKEVFKIRVMYAGMEPYTLKYTFSYAACKIPDRWIYQTTIY
jgi:hypothetical protein